MHLSFECRWWYSNAPSSPHCHPYIPPPYSWTLCSWTRGSISKRETIQLVCHIHVGHLTKCSFPVASAIERFHCSMLCITFLQDVYERTWRPIRLVAFCIYIRLNCSAPLYLFVIVLCCAPFGIAVFMDGNAPFCFELL